MSVEDFEQFAVLGDEDLGTVTDPFGEKLTTELFHLDVVELSGNWQLDSDDVADSEALFKWL